MRQSLFQTYIFERLIKHSKGTHLIDVVKGRWYYRCLY